MADLTQNTKTNQWSLLNSGIHTPYYYKYWPVLFWLCCGNDVSSSAGTTVFACVREWLIRNPNDIKGFSIMLLLGYKLVMVPELPEAVVNFPLHNLHYLNTKDRNKKFLLASINTRAQYPSFILSYAVYLTT